MRFGAFRRFLPCCVVGLAAIWLLGGCTSATKRRYLHHLSIIIEPAEPGSELVAAFDHDRGLTPAVAAAGVDDDQTIRR